MTHERVSMCPLLLLIPINDERMLKPRTDTRSQSPSIHPCTASSFDFFCFHLSSLLDTGYSSSISTRTKIQISNFTSRLLLAGWLLACWLYWLADRVGQTCLHSLSTRSSTRACLLYILQQQSYNNSTAGINHGQRSIPVDLIRVPTADCCI